MGKSAAERMQAHRQRQRDGLSTFHLVLDEVEVAEMLIAGGLLAPQDAADHRAVVFALKRQIGILIQLARGDA